MKKCLSLVAAAIFIAICVFSECNLKVENKLMAGLPIAIPPIKINSSKSEQIIFETISTQSKLQHDNVI